MTPKHYIIFGSLIALFPCSIIIGALLSSFYWLEYKTTLTTCNAINGQLMAQYQAILSNPVPEIQTELNKPRKKFATKLMFNPKFETNN